jgi:hypothetical protein
MSITLLISKAFDRDFDDVGEEIALTDWIRYVETQPDLRIRTEPYVALNPSTGARIEMAADDGDSEILSDGEWTPFLSYRDGELAVAYGDELDDPTNPIRKVIARVARHFSALIRHDAGDKILDW